MPIKKFKLAAVEKKSVVKVPRTAKRVEGVREIMLSLLEKGPLSRADLVKRGKFSEGALYVNLKLLRDEGMIESDTGNKKLRLVAGTATARVSPSPVKELAVPAITSIKVLTPVHIGRELHEALDSVLFRLAPMDHASEKLMVLEQLARTTPKPVAEILQMLAADVVRLSALQA